MQFARWDGASKKNGSDQVSVPVLAVVREEERPRCLFEMQTHTPQAIGPAAAKSQMRLAPSTLAAAV